MRREESEERGKGGRGREGADDAGEGVYRCDGRLQSLAVHALESVAWAAHDGTWQLAAGVHQQVAPMMNGPLRTDDCGGCCGSLSLGECLQLEEPLERRPYRTRWRNNDTEYIIPVLVSAPAAAGHHCSRPPVREA